MAHTQPFPFMHLNFNIIEVMLIFPVLWTMIALRCNVVLSLPKATDLDSNNSDTKEFWLGGDLGHFGKCHKSVSVIYKFHETNGQY